MSQPFEANDVLGGVDVDSSRSGVGNADEESGVAGIDASCTDGNVFFPPREVADLVLHYDSSHFHVHKFVMLHHSTVLQPIIQALSSPSKSGSPVAKKAKIAHSDATQPGDRPADTSSSSSDNAEPCNHPHIAHCTHLVLQTTMMSGDIVTAADFRLFLCHLYFSNHYRYPPYLPKTDIDLDADSLPSLSITFPLIPSLDWSASSPLRFTADGTKYSYNEPLLMLAYYLDCKHVAEQCEAVMLTKVNNFSENKVQLGEHCSTSLLSADRYKLEK